MREGEAIGSIAVTRVEVRPFTNEELKLLEGFADQAVIAIENARLLDELNARMRDLSESLEQQTATSEVLRAIASSPGEADRVLDTIARTAQRLLGASGASITRLDGRLARRVAAAGRTAQGLPLGEQLDRGAPAGRAALEKRTIHVEDILAQADEFPSTPAARGQSAARTILATPLLREDEAIGSITVQRSEVRAFAPKEIALLESFADQAVIAIENARLLGELNARNRDLAESLEQQTATSEIMRTIAQSASDVAPVMRVITESAAQLCRAPQTLIFRVEGSSLKATASCGTLFSKAVEDGFELPIGRGSAAGKAVVEGRTVHIADQTAVAEEYPDSPIHTYDAVGATRSMLSVPLLREGTAIGALSVIRTEVLPFTDKEIELVEGFADQAVIAIENARLLDELNARNCDLAESLEQQMATSEILRTIASTPAEAEGALTAICETTMRMFGAASVGIRRVAGNALHALASAGASQSAVGAAMADVPLDPAWPAGRTVLQRRQMTFGDMANPVGDEEIELSGSQAWRVGAAAGSRSAALTPLMRHGEAIGVLLVFRTEVKPFTDKELALLRSFADQAVIAIENARLLSELRESLQQQTATADVLKVISRSTFDLQTVLQTLVESAARLCEADKATITRQREGKFYRAEAYGFSPEFMEAVKDLPVEMERGSITGRALVENRTVHIPDVQADPEYTFAEAQKLGDFRTVLGVPMLREGSAIGVLALARSEMRPFTDKQIELVSTFADQAAIAIENARLLAELRESLERQTATSDVLKVISQSAFDLQRVFGTVAETAVRVCEAERAFIFRFDGSVLRVAATHNVSAERRAFAESHPIAPGRHTAAARPPRRRAPHHPHS
jgi:GAF domain-containing protein